MMAFLEAVTLVCSNENYSMPAVKEDFGFCVEATDCAHSLLGWLRMVSTRKSHFCLSLGYWGVLLLSCSALTICRHLRWEVCSGHTDVSGKHCKRNKVLKTCRIDGVVILVVTRSVWGGTFLEKSNMTKNYWQSLNEKTWENFAIWMVLTVTFVTLRQWTRLLIPHRLLRHHWPINYIFFLNLL